MRYLGDILDDLSNQVGGAYSGAMVPELKAQMMTEASHLDDARAHDLLDVAEQSPYAKHQKLVRTGITAAVAFVAGVLAARALRKRR